MANRVSTAIETCKEQIEKRIQEGITTKEAVEECRKDLDLSMDEYVRFQELKSLASMDGGLSLEEAQLVYRYLGETPSTFNDQPIHVKYVLCEVFQALLKRRLNA